MKAFFPDQSELVIVLLIGRVCGQPFVYGAPLFGAGFLQEVFDEQVF